MGRNSASGSGIRDEQPGSYFLELRNHFFGFLGLKYLNSLMRIRDPGWRHFGSGIRYGKKSDPGSGINIPDPQHWGLHRDTALNIEKSNGVRENDKDWIKKHVED
jgi:hypothetical protein